MPIIIISILATLGMIAIPYQWQHIMLRINKMMMYYTAQVIHTAYNVIIIFYTCMDVVHMPDGYRNTIHIRSH